MKLPLESMRTLSLPPTSKVTPPPPNALKLAILEELEKNSIP